MGNTIKKRPFNVLIEFIESFRLETWSTRSVHLAAATLIREKNVHKLFHCPSFG